MSEDERKESKKPYIPSKKGTKYAHSGEKKRRNSSKVGYEEIRRLKLERGPRWECVLEGSSMP